jgi:hypothetical protein
MRLGFKIAVSACLATAVQFSQPQAIAQVREVKFEQQLIKSGEPARIPNPACEPTSFVNMAKEFAADGNLNTSAQKVAEQLVQSLQRKVLDSAYQSLSKAIDAYTGVPIISTLSSTLPEFDNWAKPRLGLHAGRSSCVTGCVVVPSDVSTSATACILNTHDSATSCHRQNQANAAGVGHAAVQGFSRARLGQSTVICVTGKNWKHDWTRTLRLTAAYQPLVSAQQLAGRWECGIGCTGTPAVINDIGGLRVRNENGSEVAATWDAAAMTLTVPAWGNLKGHVGADLRFIEWENPTTWRR